MVREPFDCPVDDMCDCGIACLRAPKPTVCHSEEIAQFLEGEHRYEETLDADERQGH